MLYNAVISGGEVAMSEKPQDEITRPLDEIVSRVISPGKDNAISIISFESVRLADGRYSGGFIDIDILHELVMDGDAEIFREGGMQFIRPRKG